MARQRRRPTEERVKALEEDLRSARAALATEDHPGAVASLREEIADLEAKLADAEKRASRARKSRANSRARYDSMKSVGMTRTRYGWE